MGSREDHRPSALTVLLWSVALAIAAVFLLLFLAHISRNVTELDLDSDYASAFTLPETLVRTGTGGDTVIADAGQWVPLWFGLLTARLPLHRELWEAAPGLLFIFTALVVGWSVAQVASRRAAALAVLLSLVASSRALWFFLAAEAHNTVYPCTALSGAYLIWLTRGAGRRRLTALVVPLLAGVVLGVCLGSDLLLVATTLVPLGLTAIVTGLRRERRSRLIALSAATSIVVAVPIAYATTWIMEAQGYRTLPAPRTIASLAELPGRAKLLFKGLKQLFNGYLGSNGATGTLHSQLGLACTVVMSCALLALMLVGLRTTVRFIRDGLPKHVTPKSPRELSRSLHVIYWMSAAACACGAFWIAAQGPGVTHESYYGTVVFAVAAVIPLLLSAARPIRLLIPAGSAIFFAGSLVGLAGNYMNGWAMPDIAPVARIAAAYHVRTGYSGYSQASSLTWTTAGRLVIRPVMLCSNPPGVDICPFVLARVPSWYVPQPRRSFLLINTNEGFLYALPPGLGKPLAGYSFGPYEMLVYSYDIASRFGPLPQP